MGNWWAVQCKNIVTKAMIILFFYIFRPTANEMMALRSRDPRRAQLMLWMFREDSRLQICASRTVYDIVDNFKDKTENHHNLIRFIHFRSEKQTNK